MNLYYNGYHDRFKLNIKGEVLDLNVNDVLDLKSRIDSVLRSYETIGRMSNRITRRTERHKTSV